jgi:type I restriction enzyme, S subunit
MNALTPVETLVTDHLDLWTAALKRKSTAGRGSSSKVELYGIKKLRELIYEFAAKGLLVPKGRDAHNDYLNLSDISEFVMGQAPAGNECNKDGKGTVFVKTGEFGQRHPEIKEWTTKPLKLARKGDVLICVVGATVGKLNFGIDCAIGRSVAAIRPGEKILTEYLYISLVPFTIKLRQNSRGSAQGVIGKTELSAVKIRVPTKEEQHRIVAKVDELMALCDQLEQQTNASLGAHQTLVATLLSALTSAADHAQFASAWQRIAGHFDTLFTTEESIDQLKQTILQLAVMGKLVPQDPNDEPASELLKKIAAEKAKLVKEGKIKADKPLPPISEEKQAFKVPLGWATARLGEVIKISSGDGLTSAQMAPQGRIPVYGGNGVNGYHDQANVSKPTLVIGRVGFYCGSIHITPDRAWVTDNAFLTSFSEELFTIQYLALLLQGTNLKENENATAQPVISGKKVYPIPVCFPPVPEQHRIVAKVDELMALCDQLKSRLSDAQTTQLHLADALVERAIC